MRHPLHQDIARLLGNQVKARSIVVWYDPRAEFVPFVDELRGAAAVRGEVATVQLGDGPAGARRRPSARAGAGGTDAILCAWLVAHHRDAEIETGLANGELLKLIRSRLGLELEDDTMLTRVSSATLRYVLGREFRVDLQGAPPPGVSAVPNPRAKQEEEGVWDPAEGLRSSFPFEYETIADRVEAELSLSPDVVPPDAPGGRKPWTG